MDGSASRPRHCLYLEQAREVVRGNERTYRQAERLADGCPAHPASCPRSQGCDPDIPDPAAFGQITVGDDDPEAIEPSENLQ